MNVFDERQWVLLRWCNTIGIALFPRLRKFVLARCHDPSATEADLSRLFQEIHDVGGWPDYMYQQTASCRPDRSADGKLEASLRQIAGCLEAALQKGVAPLTAASAVPTAEDDADKTSDKEERIPKNPHVLALCVRLKRELTKGRTQTEIAQEIVDEQDLDVGPQSLLRQARRFPHLWKSTDF